MTDLFNLVTLVLTAKAYCTVLTANCCANSLFGQHPFLAVSKSESPQGGFQLWANCSSPCKLHLCTKSQWGHLETNIITSSVLSLTQFLTIILTSCFTAHFPLTRAREYLQAQCTPDGTHGNRVKCLNVRGRTDRLSGQTLSRKQDVLAQCQSSAFHFLLQRLSFTC